ncbi:MAG: hypothetical protein IPM45_10480 [Acidimicrobiales bacterium]|nr:hypothetical protein [Acidimicrobiales bacterium]
MTIAFDGLRFVWHPNDGVGIEGDSSWPTVTVVSTSTNHTAEMRATNRFLSALSHLYDVPMAVLATSATGYKGEFDSPLLRQPLGPFTRILVPAPSSVDVLPDQRLRLVLALEREAKSARSAFYRYLAYYNALDAAFDGNASALAAFADSYIEGSPPGNDPSWSFYLTKSVRHALAHTVRDEGRMVLDPDESDDQITLSIATDKLLQLLRLRTRERWPDGVRSVG